MLTKDQRTMLDQVVESLNRLYDGDSTVTDVHAVLVVCGIALRGTPVGDSLVSTAARLKPLLKSNASKQTKRDEALTITDELRSLAGDQLAEDASINPRQRHSP